jgi:hypothetical protein
MLDRSEPSAAWRLRRWRPRVDAAVLVGFPFAPLAHAVPTLIRDRIPYVVDIGDPWALGQQGGAGGVFQRARATFAERRMWQHAGGAIVTTDGQAEVLGSHFPHLSILVRPNGFEELTQPVPPGAQLPASNQGDELRLVHYGNLYGPRINPDGFFRRLATSGRWRRVVLRQHGTDWNGTLERVAQFVDVEIRPAVPWPAVLREAAMFHAALVIGNVNPTQLPSKAVQYLTLPIPRIALINDDADALATYIADKRAWTAVLVDASDAAERVADLVNRPWSHAELRAPGAESWGAVERTLSAFVTEVTGLVPPGSATPTSADTTA